MSKSGHDPPRKIGDQVLRSMGALGLEEIRNALYPTSNIAQHSTEPGMWGDRTYGDVVDARNCSAGQERRSLLAEKIKQVEMARDGRAHEPPELTQE
jgi:hypothetical protein